MIEFKGNKENFKDIAKWEDLDPKWFAKEASALSQEIEGNAEMTYVLEKLRHLEEIKELYCRAQNNRETSKVNACVSKLNRYK